MVCDGNLQSVDMGVRTVSLGTHAILLLAIGGAMVLVPNRYTFAAFMLVAIVTGYTSHISGGHHSEIMQWCAQ